MVTITTYKGTILKEPYGDEVRCDNCGMTLSKAKAFITGRMIAEEEWACCVECADEMEKKGCCFEEFGQYVYRQQKY